MHLALLLGVLTVLSSLPAMVLAAGVPSRGSVVVTPLRALPELRVLREVPVQVRVTNASDETLPGGTVSDYQTGKPLVYVGVWFARQHPLALGTFESATPLPAPLPPGASADVTLQLKPVTPGPQYAGFGLFYSQRDSRGNRPVGSVTSMAITVAPGSWIDDHRVLFLRGLIVVHAAGFALALIGLAAWTRGP